MKKGQTEMIGLVIIMILIVIGALFYVRFAVLGGGADSELKHKSDNIKAIQAYNLMNAIMNVKVCDDVFIRDSIAMCKNGESLCDQNACNYLDDEISKIVDMAISKDFILNVNSSSWSYSFGNECKFGVSSYAYKYNFEGDFYSAVFKLCEKMPE